MEPNMQPHMGPLSPNIRRLYLYVSIVLFMLILPAVIFYADGWRFKRGFGFVRTGGIFIAVPYTGAAVQINGEPVGESGFLERSFYIDNLAPSSYLIRVEREGDRIWERQLIVEPQLVTDARALLIPNELDVLAIATTTESGQQEDTRIVSVDTYSDYLAVFAATSTVVTSTASTTLPVDESDDVGLYIRDGNLFATWMDSDTIPSSNFCGRPSFCNPELTLERDQGKVTRAFFFGRGVVFGTQEGDVYFVEPDIRPTSLSLQLYSGKGSEIRRIGDQLIIKDGTKLLEVAGL